MGTLGIDRAGISAVRMAGGGEWLVRPADGRLDEEFEVLLAEVTFASGIDPGDVWVDGGDRQALLRAPDVVRSIARRHLIACRVERLDAFAARAELGRLAELGVRLVILEPRGGRDAEGPEALADAIRVRALCRRAHVNGMSVLAQCDPEDDIAAMSALGVDLVRERGNAA